MFVEFENQVGGLLSLRPEKVTGFQYSTDETTYIYWGDQGYAIVRASYAEVEEKLTRPDTGRD